MRIEFDVVQQWINNNSRVLDLGCGDGTLLSYLRDQRNVLGYGLEIDPARVVVTMGASGGFVERNHEDDGRAGCAHVAGGLREEDGRPGLRHGPPAGPGPPGPG